jgi:hypothetical protein
LLQFVVELFVLHVNAQRDICGIIRGRAGRTPSAANLASRKTVPLWQLSESTNIRTPAAKLSNAE